MVAMLSSTGMSTRAIAPVVGANQATVARDIHAGDAKASPGPSATTPVAAEAPAPVQGMDGKTYARPIRIMEPVVAVDAPPDPRRRRHTHGRLKVKPEPRSTAA